MTESGRSTLDVHYTKYTNLIEKTQSWRFLYQAFNDKNGCNKNVPCHNFLEQRRGGRAQLNQNETEIDQTEDDSRKSNFMIL